MALKTMMLASAISLFPFLTGTAHAQQSQTVQLPTFNYFAVSTSVLVPDRGAAYLGGITSSASGTTSFGPLGHASGHTTDAGGVAVSVFVHDFAAMDRLLLSGAAPPVEPAPQVLSSSERRALRPGEFASVRDIRRQQAAATAHREDEVAKHLAKARELESQGKLGVARIHYQMAHRRATGAVKDEIAVLLARQPASSTKTRH